ncbi:MAG: D-alanyl-D-alanine carboxypeptidase family protein [Alphaproteobacteria bacterium]|nr:D-alanyl-D-alanine carboxypeptidase family protein [Alphaproteobacteria bacterium]
MRFLIALLLALLPSFSFAAKPAEKPAAVMVGGSIAKQAYLIDMNTQTVLLDKGGEVRMPTSSMSKMMTVYVMFEALKANKAALTDEYTVSEKAWRSTYKAEGSSSFMPLNSKVKVEDLIRGIIIQSGNDATIVLAEGLSGSESAFVAAMNDKAQQLGMKNTHFANPSGLPDPEHYSTPQDLALLAWHLIYDFPEYYHYFAEKEFTFNNIKQGNRNPLLYKNLGVDGLKTGHADEAGYGITASAIRNGRRLILVVNGLANMQERSDEAERLINYGYDEFALLNVAKKDEPIRTVKVAFGEAKTVPVAITRDAAVTVRNADRSKIKSNVQLVEPLEAPIAKGTEIGKFNVIMGDEKLATYPLVAGESVPKLGFFPLMWAKLRFMITGKYDE